MGGVWKLILYVKDEVEWESDYSHELHKEALLDVRKLLQLSRLEEPPGVERGGKCSYCYFESVCASPRRLIFF
jgi:CRISPR/Cas system-associated exonuclease Cas4 (RecB family)